MTDFPGINRREAKAWQHLFANFYAPLCAYIEGRLGNRPDAEDIVQETLAKVWSSEVTFESEAQMAYYLYRAVHNQAISLLRKQKNRITVDTNILPDTFDDEAYVNSLREELYRQLYIAINALPLQQRRVIELSIQGKSGKEIAAILGISIHTVKAHKQKAMDNLRQSTDSDLLTFLILYLTSL